MLTICNRYIGATAEEGEERIPLWYDIHDNLLVEVWEKLMCKVLDTIYLNGGRNTKPRIMEKMRGKIGTFDVELVLKWLQKVHAIRKDDSDWYACNEYWWCVLGSFGTEA